MIRPLFINRGYYFEQSPGGECLRAFIGAMGKDKWLPVVYTSDRPPMVSKLPEYGIMTHEKLYMQYIAAGIRRAIVPDLTWIPGYEWPAWGKGVVKQIIKDIKKGKAEPDYIHSVAYPIASHWAALKVKKATGLPWVMQFYDPWADNPYRPFKTKWLKKIDWQQERKCVEAADLIIHDNESIADLWRERYGIEIGKKIVTLPLTVPLPNTPVSENQHHSNEVLTISHVGNFMLNRTSQPFILAVKELLETYPNFYNQLRVNYIGKVTEPEKELIKACGLSEIFNLTGSITADECVKYYKKSDLFLAVDGVNKDNLFFPSKILKYMYFRRPILGITPMGSVLDDELKRSGHVSLDNSDHHGIVDYLLRALTNYESLLYFNQDYWQKFKPSSVIEQYEGMVNELLKTGR